MKRTPLYAAHRALGAKFVPFGGWEMPVQYSNLVEEHKRVREAVGLFDVSHMGELLVEGKGALAFLQYVTSNDVSKLTPGLAQYSYLPNEKGGIVDDIIVYMLSKDRYLLCVNAANTDKDYEWLKSKVPADVSLKNVSSEWAQIAVQGPSAEALLQKLVQASLSRVDFKPFTFIETEIRGAHCIVARTGYTGEDGFEVFCPADFGAELWSQLLEHGAAFSVLPIGLGARDTLRLEVCYPLHGHELTDDMSALSSGLGWVTKFQKGDFIGRSELLKQKEAGVTPKLVGLEVTGKGIIRAENPLVFDGEVVGVVASGTKPPTVDRAIGLGFLPAKLSALGTILHADVRGKEVEVTVVDTPFYRPRIR